MKWHLNWLPAPLWEIWRDLTWCRAKRKEWLSKMEGYRAKGDRFAEHRVRKILEDRPTDWDDNIPKKWARVLHKRWGMA